MTKCKGKFTACGVLLHMTYVSTYYHYAVYASTYCPGVGLSIYHKGKQKATFSFAFEEDDSVIQNGMSYVEISDKLKNYASVVLMFKLFPIYDKMVIHPYYSITVSKKTLGPSCQSPA
ncbi:hypothetical protein BDF21DRAFT_397424 [Thamnidium elegans]|nr:hypothetical protein BDF21DRAFT_397424 [Thamnidium elegans]